MHPPSIVLCRIGSCLVAASLALATVHGAAAQDNWPQFRGLRAGVIEDDFRLPDQWSAMENIAWKIDVPGFGWGSPIVWGDHIFVTAAIGFTRHPREKVNSTSRDSSRPVPLPEGI